MATVAPTEDRVVIRQVEAEQVSTGGIVLPDTAQKKQARGTIIAAGPGKMLRGGGLAPMDVAVGDEVVYAKYGGSKIEVDGETLVIAKQSDLLAKVLRN